MTTTLSCYLLALALFLLSACEPQPDNVQPVDTDADILAVQQTIDDWLNKGIASQDTSRISSYLTPTFGSMEPDWFDREPFLVWILGFEEDFGGPFTIEYTLYDWHTTIHGDVAWTSLKNDGVLTVEGKAPRHMRWTETGVLVKQSDGRWLIDRYHSTYLGDKEPEGAF
ncbi:MAG TPA: nuclear transport factor 2 family protein [Rhodothermales bacterium]|nr:nuclear transport factor 2 family protein [Rhodothermales bacterium]